MTQTAPTRIAVAGAGYIGQAHMAAAHTDAQCSFDID